jgi:hypothetical protein
MNKPVRPDVIRERIAALEDSIAQLEHCDTEHGPLVAELRAILNQIRSAVANS